MSTEISTPEILSLSYRTFSESPKALQEKVFDFLNRENSQNEPRSIREEYPSVFRACPGGESLYIQEGDRIVSHAAFVEREFQHPAVRIKIGLIGSVVTHPSYRGRGFATQLIQRACKELKKRGCVVAMLWSDQTEFYAPLGFHRAGKEQDLRFSAELMGSDFGIVRPMNFDHDAHFIWRMYQKQHCRLDRSLEEQKKLLKTPKAQVFVTEKDGKLTSYLVINKGADFTDYIHEWGGDISELQRNISFCQKNIFIGKPLTLIAPHDYDISMLKQISEEKWEGVLGLIRVLDKNLLLSTYMNYLKQKNVDHVWSKNKDSILFSNDEFQLKSECDVIQLVFGDEKRCHHSVLPLFLWGFDSI